MKWKFLYLMSVIILMMGCEKGPGEGGQATIGGTVIIEDYNFDFSILRDTYPAQEYEVYLIYGDDDFYGDRVRTSYDGYFEFTYLREGDYTIFVYSKDKTLDYNTTSERIPIIREVSITSKKQKLIVDDMIVVK
ncbi:hypothetical protein [Carboxylicivirga marina]|uniref:Carboxypeptidase regulatory-like domain-containing protein n=1 Tax=Carboxylicivirga marina TaxID=2800988 RepID=A0ABS1HPM9_9BACT|nr:hypothetical protein [Carboxylicivirga marina]MBK3519435.1 hypothetical protein [Carboxylicivirga marina]